MEVEGDKLERQFYFIYKSSRAGEPLLASFLATACEHAAERVIVALRTCLFQD